MGIPPTAEIARYFPSSSLATVQHTEGIARPCVLMPITPLQRISSKMPHFRSCATKHFSQTALFKWHNSGLLPFANSAQPPGYFQPSPKSLPTIQILNCSLQPVINHQIFQMIRTVRRHRILEDKAPPLAPGTYVLFSLPTPDRSPLVVWSRYVFRHLKVNASTTNAREGY